MTYGRELDFCNRYYSCIVEEGMMNVYGLTLRAQDGRELRTLAWLPNEAVRRDFYEKAEKRGLEVIVHDDTLI